MIASLLLGAGITGCRLMPPSEAQGEPRAKKNDSVAVDTQVIQTSDLSNQIEYVGTTRPYRQVSLRSQGAGQLLDLRVDVGDRVSRGQFLGQLDDRVVAATVNEAEAEVAVRQSEAVSLQADVDNARAQTEQERIKLQQARSDAQRLQQLFKEGAISEQQVELANTNVKTAEQALRATEQQVRNRQQAVIAAQRRIEVQNALVTQEQERQSFSVLRSPINGVVLAKALEMGDLAQVGTEVLQLGDFSQVKVEVQVSELELAKIRVGQTAQVRLDARPKETLTGRVTLISPAANPSDRLVPVEITMPNPDGQIGSGLLARVKFAQRNQSKIVVPEVALNLDQPGGKARNADRAGKPGQAPQQRSTGSMKSGGPGASNSSNSKPLSKTATIFVAERDGEQTKVAKRTVQLGDRADGQVEVLSGLAIGESIVVRSSGELAEGQSVRLSLLSEKPIDHRQR
ncbi:efflux RND transporter periplasmic adaptor subunit [Alkalinema sp. FACHB-956]|uniref:efflux RND transporter periplasmic adaptor subunit n=1 Tax=Alkalinema sp. FACHB-956 TaxID=2692768 RepID=UPI001F551966|nr:efflux RND transporter periplasmic adaptor subunit [Alkalinema sp. FACHB-956]